MWGTQKKPHKRKANHALRYMRQSNQANKCRRCTSCERKFNPFALSRQQNSRLPAHSTRIAHLEINDTWEHKTERMRATGVHFPLSKLRRADEKSARLRCSRSQSQTRHNRIRRMHHNNAGADAQGPNNIKYEFGVPLGPESDGGPSTKPKMCAFSIYAATEEVYHGHNNNVYIKSSPALAHQQKVSSAAANFYFHSGAIMSV